MMYSKTIFPLTLLLLASFLLSAQSVSIKGRVVDQATSGPIPFATVAIYENDNSVPLDGTTTDLDGQFGIQVDVSAGTTLGFSFIGFEEQRIELKGAEGRQEVDLGRIALTAIVVNLDEVEVAAMAMTSVSTLERTSYRAADFETARGGTASDLLGRLPGLSVSPEGEVSVRGTTDFVVYLNGRPTQMEPDMLLAQIPANSITGIDIITVPSAAYDAQGKGGIINITTKADAQRGLSVSVNAKLGGSPWGNETDVITGDRLNDDRYGGGFNLMYGENQWLLYGGFNYDYRNLHGSRTGTARILDPLTGDTKIMDAGGLKPEWHENISANVGFDRALSARSGLSGAYFFGRRLEGRTANYLYNNYFTRNSDNSLPKPGNIWNEEYTFNPNAGIRKGLFNTAGLDYTRSTDRDAKWTVSGLYEYSLLSHDIDNPNITYDPATRALAGTMSHYIQRDETPLHGYRLLADYQKLFADGTSLSLGVQPQFVRISGDFSYDTLNVASNSWGAYSSLENSSELRRSIYAVYADASGQRGSLQYKLGLRMEHTNQHLEIDNPNYFNLFERPVLEDYKVQQTDWFPSLHAAYRISDKDNITLAASRRISRSPVKNMFPFLYRRHLEVYVVGDPALKPEYIQALELSYRKTINKQQFNLTGFYRGVTNAVFRVNTVYPQEMVLIRSFTNAGETTAAGAELNANLDLGRRAKLFLGGSLYHFRVQADIFGYQEDNRSTNWTLKGSGNFMLGSQVRLSADFDIRSAEVTAQGRNELFYMTNLAMSYTPARQKAWTFNLRALNIFDSNNRVLSTRAFNSDGIRIFYQDTDFYYYGPIAELMVTYSINRISRERPGDRSGFGRDEF